MNVATYLAGFPAFLSYFGVAIALLLAFAFIYAWATPHHEFALIRENKPAASIAFGGSMIGFVLPLYSAISNSVSLIDCLLWGLVVLLIQLLTFLSLRIFIRDLPQRIARDEIASGIFSASTAISVGVLNAACMTW